MNCSFLQALKWCPSKNVTITHSAQTITFGRFVAPERKSKRRKKEMQVQKHRVVNEKQIYKIVSELNMRAHMRVCIRAESIAFEDDLVS